jgi:hypothetical protein
MSRSTKPRTHPASRLDRTNFRRCRDPLVLGCGLSSRSPCPLNSLADLAAYGWPSDQRVQALGSDDSIRELVDVPRRVLEQYASTVVMQAEAQFDAQLIQQATDVHVGSIALSRIECCVGADTPATDGDQ